MGIDLSDTSQRSDFRNIESKKRCEVERPRFEIPSKSSFASRTSRTAIHLHGLPVSPEYILQCIFILFHVLSRKM